MTYLCYDVKGIQSFIFAVPKLKYIVGGSILIDQFDRQEMMTLQVSGTKLLFSGGGKGAFACEGVEIAKQLQDRILQVAHNAGLGVAIGVAEDYSEAAGCADRFYPFLPKSDQLNGHPCQASGLYPVQITSENQGVHTVITKRVYQRGDLTRNKLENRLLSELNVPQIRAQADNGKIEFFHDTSDESRDGRYAASSLGNRGRWAIICMDGNDIGGQFRAFQSLGKTETEAQKWVGEMSQALDQCSTYAAARGCQEVLRYWASDQGRVTSATTADGTVILPIRPIVVGGDDLVVLCHAQYAFEFVQEAIRAFREKSIEVERKTPGLWPATGGELTVSAGVLFCPISLPLHMAIPYTESLLASAKGEGRKHLINNQPSPACIDYEVITETMLDTVADRRNRELRFIDGDTNEQIELTQKPYRFDDFVPLMKQMDAFQAIPRSIRQQLLPSLRAGQSDRIVFRSQLKKRHPRLYDLLDETKWMVRSPHGSGRLVRTTSLIDLMEILEEKHRLSQSEEILG